MVLNYSQYKIKNNSLINDNLYSDDWKKLLYYIYKYNNSFNKDKNYNLQIFFKKLNSFVNFSITQLFNTKSLLINIKLFIFIQKSSHFIGYKHYNNILSLNNSIYFYNINKLIYILNQFSLFLYKILYLRGQILLVSLDHLISKDIKTISYVTNQYLLTGKWIFGLWTNWSYFYKKLWEYENLLLKSLQYKKDISIILNNKYFGLLGMRYLPDFIFFFSNLNLFSYSNLVKESYSFNIPLGGILTNFSDSRYISYPLYGDITNKFNFNFYKLLYIKLIKLSLIKRFIKFKLI